MKRMTIYTTEDDLHLHSLPTQRIPSLSDTSTGTFSYASFATSAAPPSRARRDFSRIKIGATSRDRENFHRKTSAIYGCPKFTEKNV